MAASCGTHRRVTSPAELAESSVEHRFDSMVETYKPWHTLSVPVKVELRSPSKLSLSGRAYMVRDSLIHVSMRVFGLEVAVLRATPDSVFCIDKIHKLAVVENLTELTRRTGLTLGQLQRLMLGRAFVPGDDSAVSRRSRQLSLDDSGDGTGAWTMTATPKHGDGYRILYEVGGTDNQLSSLQVSVTGHNPVTIGYADWTQCALGFMPRSMSCAASVSSKDVEAVLRYTPGSVSVDSGDVPSFRRPGGDYRIIKAADLLKKLSSSTVF